MPADEGRDRGPDSLGQLCGGMPLALRIAAAKLSVYGSDR